MPIERVILAPNGAVLVFDTRGQQVPKWQANVFCDHLRRMLEAGDITVDTPVEALMRRDGTTVRDWLGAIESNSGMPESSSPKTGGEG